MCLVFLSTLIQSSGNRERRSALKRLCDHVDRVVAVEVMLMTATKMTEEGRKFFSTECHHVAL